MIGSLHGFHLNGHLTPAMNSPPLLTALDPQEVAAVMGELALDIKHACPTSRLRSP